jgi:hypothetical protein
LWARKNDKVMLTATANNALPANHPLLKEYRWYQANQDELVKQYRGRYLVIFNQTVIGDYNSMGDAYRATIKTHPQDTFLVHLCVPESEEEIIASPNHQIVTFQ